MISDVDSDPGEFLTSDTRFLRASDTYKVMTSDTGISENLGHGLGRTSDKRIRSSLKFCLDRIQTRM